ncbi:MAG: hypothetical protein KDB27_28615 [Planctomycetales bacterium]|nr:hypothetical protein [Planctomycetales bacterium]
MPRRSRLSIATTVICFGVTACLVPLMVLGRPPRTPDGLLAGRLEKVWSLHGISRGCLETPRAMVTDDKGDIYIVDKTARIQVFNENGKFLRGWQTPEFYSGKPTGLSFDNDGNLMVADTHYFRILFYTPDGKLLEDKTLGGTWGNKPGEFGLVTDAVVDSEGFIYVAEYGEFDRIQKFTPTGEFVMQWGGHGSEPGQFIRPQNMAVDESDHIWVVDACNDRIQVFDTDGELIELWGTSGDGPGELHYPYDLILVDEFVYVCEFGNHRVQKFTRDGECLGLWGKQGRQEGELFNPWSLAQDCRGRIHVLDTYNHRVQRIRL